MQSWMIPAYLSRDGYIPSYPLGKAFAKAYPQLGALMEEEFIGVPDTQKPVNPEESIWIKIYIKAAPQEWSETAQVLAEKAKQNILEEAKELVTQIQVSVLNNGSCTLLIFLKPYCSVEALEKRFEYIKNKALQQEKSDYLPSSEDIEALRRLLDNPTLEANNVRIFAREIHINIIKDFSALDCLSLKKNIPSVKFASLLERDDSSREVQISLSVDNAGQQNIKIFFDQVKRLVAVDFKKRLLKAHEQIDSERKSWRQNFCGAADKNRKRIKENVLAELKKRADRLFIGELFKTDERIRIAKLVLNDLVKTEGMQGLAILFSGKWMGLSLFRRPYFSSRTQNFFVDWCGSQQAFDNMMANLNNIPLAIEGAKAATMS